jgi:hypothetical protein
MFKSNSTRPRRPQQPRTLADGAAPGNGQHRRPAGDVRQAAHGGGGHLRQAIQRHHLQQGEIEPATYR